MKSRTIMLVSIAMILSMVFTAPAMINTAVYTAAVNISTIMPKAIPLGMSGTHNELAGSVYRWDNPELIGRVNQYERMGYVRINGTNLNAYDWKTGSFGVEAIGQLQSDDKSFYMYTEAGKIVEAKGGENLKDLREFLQRTGTKAIVPVNVFTNSVKQIGDLAKYCFENHIPVLYFELGNEVSFYTAEANYRRSQRFKTGTDYLNRMKEYNKAIKENYPGAKTVAAMDNTRKTVFNQDFKTEQFWDAITFHRFVGDGPDFNSAMSHANNGLNGWDEFIEHYLASAKLSSRIEIGEHSVELNGILSQTHYNGIVIAENMLRLSAYPNIDHIQSWRIPLGIGYPKNDYKDKLTDAYQKNEVIDINNLTYEFYDKAPSISARVVDGALNNSTAAWATALTGGALVETLKNTSPGTVPGTMPALYAQAYRGINGKNYLVIVNKSDKTHDVKIKMDDVNVYQTKIMTYVTAAPNSKNSDISKPVYLQTANITGESVFIPAYSVCRLEWSNQEGPDIPPVPWLSHADARNNQVILKWHKSENATGYKIKYGTEPNNMNKEIDAENVTSFTVPDLTNGTTYYFAVAAYNAAGISAYSNENISNAVYVKLAAPAAPKITKHHHELSGRAVIEWESVPGAAGYKLKYGTYPGIYNNIIDAGNNVGKIVEGLSNGIRYYFAVTAYNAFGESSYSLEVSVMPSADVPLAPHDLMITGETETEVSLKWNNTRVPRESASFENGSASWNNISGDWAVSRHPDSIRDTNVYKSSSSGIAITVFENVSPGDMEGEGRITINSYGPESQAGVVARYKDKDNYYMFVYDNSANKYKIIKNQSGKSTVLAEVVSANAPTDFIMSVEVKGNQIIPRVNGDQVFGKVINDSRSPLTGGIFGLITVNQMAFYDEVLLRKAIGAVNVYRSNDPYKDFILLESGVEGNTWNESGLDPEKSYYYRVTSVYMGNESYSHSNTVLKD